MVSLLWDPKNKISPYHWALKAISGGICVNKTTLLVGGREQGKIKHKQWNVKMKN